jgi:hypothetical protein
LIKHAPELLDDIWKQIHQARVKFYKPELRIWLNAADLQTLVIETRLVPRDASVREILSGNKSIQLFGEETFVAPDTKEGEPVVEIFNNREELI